MDNFCKKEKKVLMNLFIMIDTLGSQLKDLSTGKKINIQPICYVDSPGHKILNHLFAGTNKTKSGPCEE